MSDRQEDPPLYGELIDQLCVSCAEDRQGHLADILRAAVLREREAIAVMVEGEQECAEDGDEAAWDINDMLLRIAAAIRGRE